MNIITVLPSLAALIALGVMIAAYSSTVQSAREIRVRIDKSRKDRP